MNQDREPLTPHHVAMIVAGLGTGALILDLHKTDYSRGVTLPKRTEAGAWHGRSG